MSFGQFASTTQFFLYGKKHFTKTGWIQASKKYPQPDILLQPHFNLNGKVYLITGGNAGLGFEMSRFVAAKGATLFMMCRSLERGESAREKILTENPNAKIFLLIGDCALEQDIRRCWNQFLNIQKDQIRLQLQKSQGQGLSQAQGPQGEVEVEVKGKDESLVDHAENSNINDLESRVEENIRLDNLICNAGALADKKSLTSEGIETTFAAHLLFGTYLLGALAMPLLIKTKSARLIVVSSGGMYNTKFPKWSKACALFDHDKFDGQMAYAYAKRGQVILCQEWAKLYPQVKIVSAHPGWTMTPGVESAYGANKKYLEPLRSLWEGAEGIIWLSCALFDEIESGAFYLDRSPQVKHMAGPFFTEGSFTKNSPAEVESMMENLKLWSDASTRPDLTLLQAEEARNHPLLPMNRSVDVKNHFMGRWFVIANIPSRFEVGASNCIENYKWNDKENAIDVTFQYMSKGNKTYSQTEMRGFIKNEGENTHWNVNPKILFYLPVNLSYLMIDYNPEMGYTIISVPDRSYLWIMTRTRPLSIKPSKGSNADNSNENSDINASKFYSSESQSSNVDPASFNKEKTLVETALAKCAYLGFSLDKINRVNWTDDELPKEP